MPVRTPNLRASRRAASLVALAALVIVSCRPAAAVDAGDRCFRDKMRVSRVVAARAFLCDDQSECLAKTAARADHLLASVDVRALAAGFVCPGGADALGLIGTPSSPSWPSRFVRELTGFEPPKCNSRQVRAARAFASAYSRCVALSVPDSSELGGCTDDAREDFAAAWSAALVADTCPGADVDEAMTRIEDEINETASRLQVHCGDGVVAGFEECDDGNTANDDGCSAECRPSTCGHGDGGVGCVACPDDSVPNDTFDGCRCADGYAGEPGSCTDVDECAATPDLCPADRPCVNLAGTYACSIACTADAFHAALASCGAPNGAIAFNCSDTVIPLPAGAAGAVSRENSCNDLLIDGAGRNITFELAPACWQMPLLPEQCPDGLEPDGTCWCPNVDSGEEFVQLRGNRNTVRDLTIRGFFEGIPVRGAGNVVENVRFDRLCDDAFGSVLTGVGNVFRHLEVTRGCDKCSENGGTIAATDPDPRVDAHYNAVLSDIEFDGCRTPVRVASSGRFLLDNVRMHPSDDPDFPCDGPRFTSATNTDEVIVEMRGATIDSCRHGVRFGRGADGRISDSRISGCTLRGLRAAVDAQVSVRTTTLVGNGGSGSSEPGFGGVAVLDAAAVDLGGGALVIDGETVESPGKNSICANVAPNGAARELDVSTAAAVPAIGNWWCSADSPMSRIVGPAVVDPVLDRAPVEYRP